MTQHPVTEYHGDHDEDPWANQRIQAVVAYGNRTQTATAVVPRSLVTLPIWHGPTRDATRQTFERAWRYERDGKTIEHQVSTANKIAPQYPGAGPLTFYDLDLTMAISCIALASQNRLVTVPQMDCVRWLGYSPTNYPSSDQINGSLLRLAMTDIIAQRYIVDGDERTMMTDDQDLGPQSPRIPQGEHTPPIRVLGMAELDRRERSNLITASLSDYWLVSLIKDRFQEVQMDAYCHLARNYRRFGLARVIFAFLTAYRQEDYLSFAVPWATINTRYALRHNDGSLKYTKPTANNNVIKALNILAESGIVKFASDSLRSGMVAGRFSYEHVPRLRQRPMQTVFLDHALMTESTPKTQERLQSPPLSKDDPLEVLRKKIGVARSLHVAALRGGEWLHEQLIVLYAHSLVTAKNGKAGGYAAKILRANTDQHLWSREAYQEDWSPEKVKQTEDIIAMASGIMPPPPPQALPEAPENKREKSFPIFSKAHMASESDQEELRDFLRTELRLSDANISHYTMLIGQGELQDESWAIVQPIFFRQPIVDAFTEYQGLKPVSQIVKGFVK